MTPNLRQVGQRLKEYMQTRGLTIAALARMSSFSRQELDAMVDGGAYPVSQLMVLLATFEDLNPHWLLHGEKPMLLRGTPKPKREFRDDLEARDTVRRLTALPPANPELRQQVARLEEEVRDLRHLAEALAARLARLEAQP